MRFSRFMRRELSERLELDHVSTDLKTFLTRKLLASTRRSEGPDHARIELIFMNQLINLASTIVGGRIYKLESDDHGEFDPAEYAWHQGEFHLMLRRMNSAEIAEMLCELIEREYFETDTVNDWLDADEASFRISKALRVEPVAVTEDEGGAVAANTHPNIGLLVERMERCFDANDYSGVLHASASIYETMAKDVVGLPTIQNQTLAGFFERYRKDSSLPDAICDYILEVYKRRNTTPLAGHGSTAAPDVSSEEAALLVELTKAFVRTEYRLLLKPIES